MWDVFRGEGVVGEGCWFCIGAVDGRDREIVGCVVA